MFLSISISRRVFTCIAVAGLFGGQQAMANTTIDGAEASAFDIETLKSRGIDPKLAQFFAESSRFLPGREKITLYVNGDRIGTIAARFDEQSELCFDEKLLTKAGLVIPQEHAGSQPDVVNSTAAEPVPAPPPPEQSSETSPSTVRSAEEATLSGGILKHAAGPISAWATTPTEPAPIANESIASRTEDGTCYDFIAAFPQTEVDLRPEKQEVHVFVPQEALKPVEQDFSRYSTGGVAGLLNYDALTMQSQSSSIDSEYSSLNTEAGLNIGDWALRSRQNLIDQNGERTSQHLYAYAQRTFLPLDSIVQAGQINIASPVFSGASITGIQMLPDNALTPNSAGGATVEGIAQTSQARVEIKQDGILIHSAVVPIGPFTLRGVQLLRGNSNVDVTIFESDGSEHSFSLPAASLHQVSLTTTGLSMAGGKVRDVGDSGAKEPEVFTVSNDWLLGDRSKISAGLLVSADYNSTGAILDTVISKDTSISVSNVVSQAKEEGKNGIQSSITARTKIVEGLTASGSFTHRSDDYRDLLDTTQLKQGRPIDVNDMESLNERNRRQENEFGRGNTQISANLAWNTKEFGGGGLGFVQSQSGDGDWGRSLSASWGKSFNGVSVNATFQKDMTGDAGNVMFLSVSIPLGQSRSLQTRVSRSGNNDAQIGATYNETVNDALNYSLSAYQQGNGNGTNLSGNVSALPRYAQVNLDYAQDGNGGSSYSVGARGALAFHEDGITPSPYQIHDTFGIISVGEEAGIKITTPNGNVWTDAGGRAVVAQVPAYTSSHVQVATDTLPRNVDIANGHKTIEAGRGSVSRIDFSVVEVRRVLLRARDKNDQPLPKGALVLTQDENYITTVVDDGTIFLEDAFQNPLMVNLPGGDQCELTFDLPEEVDIESHFTNANAVCSSKSDVLSIR